MSNIWKNKIKFKSLALLSLISSFWETLSDSDFSSISNFMVRPEAMRAIYDAMFEYIRIRDISETLKKELREAVIHTVPDVYDWLQYCIYKLNYRYPRILWTSNCLLDVERMMSKWLEDSNPPVRLRFRVACEFCLEDKLRALSDTYPNELEQMQEGNVDGTKYLTYWRNRLSNVEHHEECCTLELAGLNSACIFTNPYWVNGVISTPAIKYFVKTILDRRCVTHTKSFLIELFSTNLNDLAKTRVFWDAAYHWTVISSNLLYFLSQLLGNLQLEQTKNQTPEIQIIMFSICLSWFWAPKREFWEYYVQYNFKKHASITCQFEFYILHIEHIRMLEEQINREYNYRMECWTRYSKMINFLWNEAPAEVRSALNENENFERLIFLNSLRQQQETDNI